MKKALALVLFLTTACALVFAAGTDEQATDGDPEELRLMWWGSQRRHEITIDVLELYGERNNVDVTYEFAGFSDYWTKLSTMAAGRNLPDVMQLGYPHLGDWQGRGMLIPLDEYAESGVLDLSNIPSGTLDGGRIDGELYAVSLGVNTWAFVLDVDMFEEAGLALPSDDWSWDDFEQTAMELNGALDDVWGMGAGLPTDQIWRALYLSSGMQPFDYTNGGLGYTDDQILVDHLEMILELQEAGAIPHISVQASDYAYGENPEIQPIIEGDAAMSFIASNQLVAQWTAAGGPSERNFTLATVPRSGEQSANWLRPSMLFAVTRDSESPETAADFVSFFVNDIEANRILMAERGVPVATDVRDELASVVDRPAQVVFEFIGRIADNAVPIPPPAPQGWNDLLQNVWQPVVRDGVLFGEVSPQEAAETFREEAADILD